MPIESSLNIAEMGALLARLFLLMMPKGICKLRGIANVLFLAHAKELQEKFDIIGAPKDRHDEWRSIKRAATVLNKLGIPHPGDAARPNVWRAFLALIVVAADDGDVGQARGIMSSDDWSVATIPTDFAAPSPPPPSKRPPPGPPGHPGERIYTARSPADILGKLKNWTTTLDMQQFSQRHLGKWIRVQNTIRDIGIDGSTIFVIVGKEKFGPVVHLAFSREKWQENLESMNKGDRIAAEGIIAKIEYPAMYVGNCALVEERDEDDPF